MIKIISGFYSVKRLSSKSGAITLSDAEEKRLVSLGVAEYVSVPETPAQRVQEKADNVSDTGKAVKAVKQAKTTTKGKAAKKK